MQDGSSRAVVERKRRGEAASWLTVALASGVLVALLRVSPAGAHATGETGHSKDGCNSCHSGGVAPDVNIAGPDTVGVGATAMYRFEVHARGAQQRGAGFDVSASGGRLGVVANQDEQLAGRELTHTMPQHNASNVAGWNFSWTAPSAAGPYALFAAGNSVNLNGQPTGDRSNTTMFAVMVVADDAPTPTPVGGTPSPGNGSADCTGDCDASGVVTVSELVTLVDIALGAADPAECPAGDANRDGQISVDEIVQAVANALSGCPAADAER